MPARGPQRQEGPFVKQTEKQNHDDRILPGQAGAGRDVPQEDGKPASWRKYIEDTEAAQKKADRQAQRERAAENRKRANPLSAMRSKARAAAAALRAKTGNGEDNGVGELKEKAVGMGKAVAGAAGTTWERVCDFTANGRATAKVRGLIDRHPVSPLLYATLLAVIVGAATFRSQYVRAYTLNVDGQEVGVVSSLDDKDAIVNGIESRASDILGERYAYNAEIDLIPVYVTPDELSDTALVEDALFEDVGAWMTAYGLRVDGVELGYAATEGELYQLLDEAAQPYLTENTVKYNFVEDVEVYPIEMPSNTKFDLEPIRETLSQKRVEQSVYEVKKGDTFNAIAYSLGMWPNELSVLNPDVMVNKIWVGDELIIQEAVPFLSVENVTDETYEEVVASPVEYIETADLYVGNTRVKEQGEDGLQLVNANVTYVNGVEVAREILSTETLVEPTTTYAYTGTTPRPVTASNGYFIWPVRGTITSNFGGRNLWGSYDFHLGLDIACPTGTEIKAADGGTVIKAGWSGSYGNLVAIRHDNGYVTYYAHNSSILVSVGQKVYQGQVIARAGMTGNASGPHCHFEVRINGTSVNPRNYLP